MVAFRISCLVMAAFTSVQHELLVRQTQQDCIERRHETISQMSAQTHKVGRRYSQSDVFNRWGVERGGGALLHRPEDDNVPQHGLTSMSQGGQRNSSSQIGK